MRLKRIVAITLAVGLLLTPGGGAMAQQAASSTAGALAEAKLSDALLKRLPPDLREKANSLLTIPEQQQQRLLNSSDEDLRVSVTALLSSSKPEAADFLIAYLEREQSAKVRASIIRPWESRSHWRTNPLIYSTLTKLITSDPDPGVSLMAAETCGRIRLNEISKLLAERLETARRSGDHAGLKRLALEQERWISIENGTMLPAFLRVSPPLFSLKPAEKPIRVVAFGDFGTGSEAQTKVAAAVNKYHRQSPFDFGITLGDNFYPVGMESPSDPRWTTQWEQLYQPLGFKFYATLGNHDLGTSG